ncbi:uracil-DNA glycosylase family protein [Lentilactobacillus sp. Marseille-Q4993]|uniref:uracil-DNA glycosylase family protein n=1 Tax=Lentilactobacillus sp. Marseille-Q4993 TaxID=3039492 RepID=UPI0024BD1772|nr:uracil-DNA glycosylase family protein [Lentilactobacillus sp. Marseille-Q4993]
MTFADEVLSFQEKLSNFKIGLPKGYTLINPYSGVNKILVKQVSSIFYKKYYDDNRKRRLIIGSSPARRGTAITEIPFEDAEDIAKETGLSPAGFHISKASSSFLKSIMTEYGGKPKFYQNFYLSFVFPLGISRTNSNNHEVNCNFYESSQLRELLTPYIKTFLEAQLNLGIDTSVCYCIGSGDNYKFLSKINDSCGFFKEIIPLEHPRFITQYNSKNVEMYKQKYISALTK